MPIVKVYGLVNEMTEEMLVELYDTILKAVVAVKELKLEEKDVTVFFPKDLMQKGLGDEVIIFVDGLFERPERTKEVKKLLADILVMSTAIFFSKIAEKNVIIKKPKLIECFVRSFDPESPNCAFFSFKDNA
ncbi:MAG: hypothetical protein NTU58_03420 [Candidatus Nealsonbacteria bacterium]|nr:hypothetical protein [Candidatus Nealsonbacteria bacterium]